MLTYGYFYQMIVLLIFVAPILALFRHKADKLRITAAFLLAVYTVFAVGMFFFPILYDTSMFKAAAPSVNLIPLHSILEYFQHFSTETAVKQVVGNVMVFLPIGFLIPILFAKFRHFAKLVLLSFLLSVSIEMIQYLISAATHTPNRAADIDDVILNLMGGMLGFCLYRFFESFRKNIFSNLLHRLKKNET